jgi:hypothetical protein
MILQLDSSLVSNSVHKEGNVAWLLAEFDFNLADGTNQTAPYCAMSH